MFRMRLRVPFWVWVEERIFEAWLAHRRRRYQAWLFLSLFLDRLGCIK